jgi:plastocyanin
MGLYPSETIPASVYLARKSQKNSLKFLMNIQSTTTTTTTTTTTSTVATVNTISLVISGANGSSDYIFESNPAVEFDGGNDPAITVKQGDILEITNQMSAHPLYITDNTATGNNAAEANDGTDDKRVTTGVTGAPAITGSSPTIRWDTANVPLGTYHYQCSAHAGMSGTITVTAP